MRYRVELDARHLKTLSAPLLTGVVELIWNSIDADARDIRVLLKENSLGGITELHVIDDGHGIDMPTARQSFIGLGSSWKSERRTSRTLGRPLHGRLGRGRFRLFRHGGTACWDTISEIDGERRELAILFQDGENEVEIRDLGETGSPPGTRVVISGFGEPPRGLRGQAALDRLLSIFALRIQAHGLRIEYDGHLLDPSKVLLDQDELIVKVDGVGELPMDVVQWSRRIGHQDLYLCDSGGAMLSRAPTRVIAPGVNFTAYLRWDGVHDHGGNVEIPDLDANELGDAVNAARRRLGIYFDALTQRRQQRIISDWRSEGVYPFDGPPADEHAKMAQQAFDVVALEAATTVNRSTSKQTRHLSLRLLREALEQNPGHVHRVLGDVLALPRDRLDDLGRLLERTELSQIISSSRSIADRLDFLHALARLTTAPEVMDRVGEQQHLHRMLEDEAWVFGEQYSLAVSEAGLTEVLKQHVRELGRDDLVAAPVRDANGRLRRVDLMLSAAVPHSDDVREHLVVELKRPSVSVGSAELEQIENYATTVAADPRFDSQRTRWEFWVVSTSVVGSANRRRRERGRPSGLAYDDGDSNIRVWVKTWGEIIHDAEHRLKYVKSRLGVTADERSAVAYLRRVHAEKLPEPAAPAADDTAEPSALV